MRKLASIFHAVMLLLLLFFPFHSFSQSSTVSGTVKSADKNEPLTGATVKVDGAPTVVQTNDKGNYLIKASVGQTLTVSYIGYATQKIKVTSNVLNITMELAVNSGDEVVVTAYGQKRSKKELSYQVQEIKGDEVADTRRENFLNALAGRVAGATITPSSGMPGASTQIMLRGGTSIDGNNQPLFVVDGIPYDNQTLNQENIVGGGANRNSDYGNRGADINPEDIETITILKGPEAAALYGSDGAAGAIIITTRKGTKGKASVYYDNSFSWANVNRFPKIQTDYGRGINGISDNSSTINMASISSTLYLSYFGDKIAPGTQVYNNMKNFYQTGTTQNHNLSVEGGSDAATYRLSANYLTQTGTNPGTGFDKFSAKMSGTLKVSSKINILSSLTYTKTNTDKVSKGTFGSFLTLLTWPFYDDVTNWVNANGTRRYVRGTSAEYDNPLWDANKNPWSDKMDRITGNVTANIQLFPWWTAALTTGVDYYTQIGDRLVNPLSSEYVSVGGYYSIYEQTTRNISNQLSTTFRKKINDFDNRLSFGFVNDDNRTDIQSQDGTQLYEPDFRSINNTLLASRNSMYSMSSTRKVRFWGNYNLSFRNGLANFSLTGSREGNSTFMSRKIDKDPFYNFGAASLNFVLSDLEAIKKITWITYLKPRVSYGTTGKGPATPFNIDPKFTPATTTGGGYSLGTTAANYNLQPERTYNIEYGAEMQFFKNRFSLDFTIYNMRSKNQIVGARVSYGTGSVIQYINGGEVTNKGIEILANVDVIKSKNFNWRTTLNYSRNRGTITQMPSGLPTYYNSDSWVAGNIRSQMFVGAANGNLAGFISARNTNGQLLINPSTGLPTYNAESFVSIGNRAPDWTGGIINRFSYKNLTLSFTLDIRRGGQVFNGNEFLLYHIGLSTRTVDRNKLVIFDGVLQDGMQNTTNPTKNTVMINPLTMSDYYSSVAANPESQFIETVNWVRMRDLTLSYSLPSSWLKKQKVVSSASVFLVATDLFMLTNYSGADPSVSVNNASARGYGGGGIDFGSLAAPRVFSAGCKVKF
ncbi:MAG: SusC/RagA family TonB-linked outer membrane protein [Filimonas sp.]|nr:SusC/RagA family TonB-linked outer membrane protein [Filimonas sp.]